MTDQSFPETDITKKITPDKSIVEEYFAYLWQILRHPTRFFRSLSPSKGNLSKPLAFALVTHWIGTVFEYIWSSWFGSFFALGFQRFIEKSYEVIEIQTAQKDQFLDWIFGFGSVVTDPFITLTIILISSLFIFFGARILISPSETRHPLDITYESAVKIVCYGLTPSIFLGIPLLGGFASSIWVFSLTVIAIKEVYQIDLGRGIVIALFPKLLLFGMMLVGLLVFAFSLIKILFSFV